MSSCGSPVAKLPCIDVGTDDDTTCQFVDGINIGIGETLYATEWDSPGWVASSMPPEGTLEGSEAVGFEVDPLLTYHTQHNAGIESAWCRKSGQKTFHCVGYRLGIEFHGDWSNVDLRSRSGRFIFYTLGRLEPFEIFDVVAMRVATSETNRVIVRPGAGTFGPSATDRLFVVSGLQLFVFAPNSDSSAFEEVSGDLPWNRQLGLAGKGDTVVGLIAPSAEDLISVYENGLMTRLEWKTGITSWARAVPGIGVARTVRRSADGDHFVVVGTEGMRLVRSRDGLLRSGVLVPPQILEHNADRSPCMAETDSVSELTEVLSDLEVEAGPTVVVRCGLRRFAWKPKPYSGDKLARLAELSRFAAEAKKAKGPR